LQPVNSGLHILFESTKNNPTAYLELDVCKSIFIDKIDKNTLHKAKKKLDDDLEIFSEWFYHFIILMKWYLLAVSILTLYN